MKWTELTSKEIIDQVRSLRKQSQREQSALFYAEGTRIAGQAVKHGWQIAAAITSPELVTSKLVREIIEQIQSLDVPILEVKKKEFNALSFKGNTSGIGVVVQQQTQNLADLTVAADDRWIALDGIGNPGSVGAVLRSSDAAGFQGVILLESDLDAYHPSAMRASMGAIFSQMVIHATTQEFIAWKDAHEVRIIGTDSAAEKNFWEATYRAPLVIMLGSEREGLSSDKKELCDDLVTIPMQGENESLNLSVAASLVMYEAVRGK